MTALRRRSLAFLTLLLIAGPADAVLRCKVSATPINFGVYLPLDPSPLDSVGTVTALCQGGLGIIRFHLSPGNSGDAANRFLVNGAYPLSYNIFVDPARTRIWGDGTGGTSEAVREQTRRGRMRHEVTAYGRIPTRQNAAPGPYVDDIVVTVIF